MRLFLDTANIDEIIAGKDLGVIEGVTTNPSLIARETGQSFQEAIEQITGLIPGPVSAEVISTEAQGMVEEARGLAAISDNVVIKVPITGEGLKATRQLAKENIQVNMTLIFSPNQALLAARAGASFISPFVGRLDDIGEDGIGLIADIAEILGIHGLSAEIISASIRHPRHVFESAMAGADIATVPYKVLLQMIEHPLTSAGVEKFLADWDKMQK